MSAILGNNPANRLVEVLAGSTILLSESGAASDLPLSLSPLTAAETDDPSVTPLTSGVLNTLAPVAPVSGASVLDGSSSTDGILPDSIANLLGNTALIDPSNLFLDGRDSPIQPVFDAANTAVLDLHQEIVPLGFEVGVGEIAKAATVLGETAGLGYIGNGAVPGSDHVNIISDTLNLPGEIATGDLSRGVAHLGADLSDTINAASALKDAVIFGPDPSNPVPELISGLGHDLQSIPLLTINGGNNAGDGGVLGGIVGDISGSSSGHLIDVDVGPAQGSGGLVLDVLSQPEGGPHNAIEVNAVDVGPNGPHVADIGLLTGADGLNISNLNGAGTDSLVGNVLDGRGTGVISGSSGTTTPNTEVVHDAISAVHDVVDNVASNEHGILNQHGTHII